MRGFGLALLLSLSAAASAQDRASVFLAQGEPPATHRGYSRFAAFAPAQDGTRLAVTWYLPQGAVGERFPALLWYHPGHRESIDLATGTIRPIMAAADIAFFTAQDYAVAVAEMRGSGASFGSRELDRGPQIGRDGRDVVDWIARQAWSSGKVGMIGASYQGFSQYAGRTGRRRRLAQLCAASRAERRQPV